MKQIPYTFLFNMSEKPVTPRQINTFRKPYNYKLTPYKETEINVNVSRFCRNFSHEIPLKRGKVIFIGNPGVGKTSLIQRFCENKFSSAPEETTGIDFELQAFNILGVPFKFEMYACSWDTAGQERFKWIVTSYYRGANAIVAVFDLSDISTLYACGDWLDEAGYENDHDYVFLVGNKLDTISEYVNAGMKQIISPLSEKFKAEYWVVSSKTGKNVKHLFWRIAFLTFKAIVLKQLAKENKSENEGVSCDKIRLESVDEKIRPNKKCTC